MRFCSLAGFSINEVHSGRWLQTSHYIAALELARKGLGVALVPDFLADQYVASGELRFFSDHKMATNEDYYLCVKISRCDEMATMALIQWFKKQVASKNSKQLIDAQRQLGRSLDRSGPLGAPLPVRGVAIAPARRLGKPLGS